METHHLSTNDMSIDELHALVNSRVRIELSPELIEKIKNCRQYLDEKLESTDGPIYGINTGFGSLCNVSIGKDDLSTLQKNLVLSHACGIGETIPQEIIRWMLLLKIRGLSYGHSGVQLETVKRLIDLYNENLLPVVYAQGSLGASGDLAPLAHLSLPLIGEGQLWQGNAPKATKELYWSMGWEAIELKAKEGLALLNGTQFMSAFACYLIQESTHLLSMANAIAAMSLEAFDGRVEPFGKEVNEVRRQRGQIEVAATIRQLLEGSRGMERTKTHVQDPYSFRCIPQVHGASYDAIEHAREVTEREINAVTDNPTIFPEQDMIVSAGNFHGQPLALVLDHLALAVHELGSISERRTYKLISGQRNLPEFLVANPGLNSGFMIPQYTAASIVSQNRQLVTPSSADSIDSSNGQEDHVSMGANAATKALRVIDNVRRVLAIELLNAAQALEIRGVNDASESIIDMHRRYRKQVPFVENDEYLHPLIQKSIGFLRQS